MANSDAGGRRQGGRRSAALSARELELLDEFAKGHSVNEVAAAWGLSIHTVRTHARNILRKLDARTRAHAVAIACSEHAIEPGLSLESGAGLPSVRARDPRAQADESARPA